MMLVSGIGNAFPVLVPPLLDEFGGSRAATVAAVTLLWIGGAAFGPVAGRLVDRWNPRLVVALGLVAAALGLAGAMLAPTLALFTLCLGVGGGVGVGLTGMVTQAAVIAETYRRRRGFATGIAFSGSMAGYAVATPAHWLITSVGWRLTLLSWALVLLALVPAALRLYPARLGARLPIADGQPAPSAPGVGALVRSAPFWALVVVFTMAPLVGYLVTVQHAVYLPTRGIPAGEAATMLLVGGMLSMSGRAAAGLVADRFGAPLAGIVSYSLSLLGVLCLVGLELTPARALAWGYLIFVFLPLGSRATIVSVLVSRIAPPGAFGTVFGLLVIGNSLGAAIGPLASGAIWDLWQSYLVIYLVALALLATALASFVRLIRATAL